MNMLGAEACSLSTARPASWAATVPVLAPSSPFPLFVLEITGTLRQETVGRSESLRSEINGSCPLRLRTKPITSVLMKNKIDR